LSRKLTAAALSGLVCPGAGQLYNRQRVKGAALIAATLGLVAAMTYGAADAVFQAVSVMPPDEVLNDLYGLARRILEENARLFRATGWALLAVWVYGIVDAYLKADGHNTAADNKEKR
jgi:TM2 domain-containing membrane protein YozV